MSLPPEHQQLAATLELRYHRVNTTSIDRHEAAWHRLSGVERIVPDDTTKRAFIEVRRYRLNAPEGTHYSYQVGSTFETRLGWLQLHFYSLTADLVLIRLAELETEITAIQAQLFAEEREEAGCQQP